MARLKINYHGHLPMTSAPPLSEIIGHPDLETLYAYWMRQRGTRPMPSRADIDPKDFAPLLPEIFLVDIFHPLRFRFRLVGSSICHRWHENLTGKWLDQMAFDGELHAVIEQYSSVARTGKPRVDIEEFINERQRYLHYRRLLLPLSSGGGNPTMIFGIQKAIGTDGYFVDPYRSPRWV